MTETIPKSLMQQAFETHRESIKLVGDKARGSRAEKDAIAFAKWVRTEVVATQAVFEQAFKDNLTAEELADNYSSNIRSNLKAALYSTKKEVIDAVDQWKAGAYIVGLRKAAEMARNTEARKAAAEARKAEKAAAAVPAPPVEVTKEAVTPAPEVPVMQQVEALLDTMTEADLRLVQESINRRLQQKRKAA